MADSKRYSDWFKKAHSDHIAAKILFEHGADYSLVAFHAQQAVEKALKGYILKNGGDLVDGHSLVFLVKRASHFDKNIQQLRKECAYLNQFYVETRYPADIPDEVTKDEALRALKTADTVIDLIA